MRLKALGLILCAYVFAVSSSFAAIPPPLVNLDASGLADTTDLTSWANTGTLGGAFSVKLGTGATTVSTVAGKKAVNFNGVNGLQSDTTTTLITGKAPYTVAAWVYAPAVVEQGWFFQWGGRGTASRAGQLGYGNRAVYGAFSGNGQNADMAFMNGVPATGVWHHIAVSYDSMVMRMYVDGALELAEGKVMDTQYSPFSVGRYIPANTPQWGFNGAVASVKLYAAALSAADIISLYTAEGGATPPAAPATPTVLNPSFETPAYTTVDRNINVNSYLMRNWWASEETRAGLTRKGTTSSNWWASSMGDAPDGIQVGWVQNNDGRTELRQLVNGFKAKKAYTVSVKVNGRLNHNPPPVMISINGRYVMDAPQVVPVVTGTTPWTTVTSNPWVCPADGAYWVSFHTTQGRLNTGLGDRESWMLIDNVQIAEVTAPPTETMIANPVGGQSWGIVTSAAASSAKNIVVTNTGTSAITITDVFLDGGLTSKFTLGTVAPGKTATIAAGGTLTIPVTFNPASAAVGVYTAKIVVVTSDAVNPTKNYSCTAAVQVSAAGKRTILVDDTGVSLGYNDATGFGQFGGATAIRDANLAINALATTATTDMMIVDGNGVADTFEADFTVRQPAVTIRQVANSQGSDVGVTIASNADQADAIVKIAERDCAIQGLSAAKKMVMLGRFPVKTLMVGIGGLNTTYNPGFAARNFVLSNASFQGYGEGSYTYSPYATYNNVEWDVISGESSRINNASTAMFPLAQTTFNNCVANHNATNQARYFLPLESANTSVTWNNSTIANKNLGGERGTVWYGNGGSVVANQTYTYNDCTFDYRNTNQALMSGWTTPGAKVIYNNPTFLGPLSTGNGGGLLQLVEATKYMNVTIKGTPTKKVDLTVLRDGVNSPLPIIRFIHSNFTFTDCIIDDKIDINAARGTFPAWNATTTLDRCYVLSEIGYNASRKIKHTVNATNSIFKTSAATTTSLFLASSDSTSTANINHCTFISDNGALATAPFIWNDVNTPVTINNSMVLGPKPLNNLGIVNGATNILAAATAVNGTNNLTGTIATAPNVDATGHLVPGTLNITRTGAAPTVNIDYDGDPRPYAKPQPIIGADEANLVPVELSTFQAE